MLSAEQIREWWGPIQSHTVKDWRLGEVCNIDHQVGFKVGYIYTYMHNYHKYKLVNLKLDTQKKIWDRHLLYIHAFENEGKHLDKVPAYLREGKSDLLKCTPHWFPDFLNAIQPDGYYFIITK